MIRHAIALALFSAPVALHAQTTSATEPVTVEIVANGQVTVPAQRFRISVTLTAKGEDEEAASKALAANRQKLLSQLTAMNIREAEPNAGAPSSLGSLFAGFAGRTGPVVTMDTLDDGSDAKPQSSATETLLLDAPSRVALTNAHDAIEANGGKTTEEGIPLLADYVAPTRQAKADALKKAQGEAEAYAAALGLRRAAIVKISERQDMAAGALGVFSEMITMFAPKPNAQKDSVSVVANIVVEFRLTR